MLTNLILIFFLETIQPSYSTLIAAVPEEFTIMAAAPTLSDRMAPLKTGISIEPVVDAQSIFSLDISTDTPLLLRNIFIKRPIASIGKLVTAMVIMDNQKPDEVVTVSRHASREEPSKMWLKEGEKITVENLLTGLLVGSANDSAVALAEFNAGNEVEFVKKMNKKAAALSLKNTHFSNVMGFDEPNNYSTAYDTMLFSREALKYPFIKKTVRQKSATVTSVDGETKHDLKSTNMLLENSYFNVMGLKTGTTPAAGQSFVSYTMGPNDHEIITVILDSPDRFKETKIVLDWIFRNFNFPTLK